MIILASASKARRKLIKICKRNAVLAKSDIDETRLQGESLFEYLERITYLKAVKFVSKKNTVISADTVIVFEDKIIGKPKSRQNAFEILKNLEGKKHFCFSGVTVLSNKRYEFFVDYAVVYMDRIGDKAINDYLDKEDYKTKAAGYGIQGLASKFMYVIKGDITTVIGLPMKKLCKII